VHDGGAHLGLDVVADDRNTRLLEPVIPVLLSRDEHRNAVHETAAGLEDLLHVPLGGLLGADGKVGDDHVGVRVLEDLHDVGRRARRLGDLLAQVLAQAVVGHPAVDLDAQVGNLGVELQRVVLAGEDRLAEVLAHLLGVDVKGGGELDVADVVAAQIDMHESRDGLLGVSVAVVVHPLNKGAGAVADADDRHPDLVRLVARAAVVVAVALGSAVGIAQFGSVPSE
jgi:hypothetical protein